MSAPLRWLPLLCVPGVTLASEGDTSNLQVLLHGVWFGVCCDDGTPRLSDDDCRWTESDRTLTDESADDELDCDEGGPDECDCDGSGERMHGWGGAHLDHSIGSLGGGPVYPDYHTDTCVVVDDDGELRTAWTDESDCPFFRLQ